MSDKPLIQAFFDEATNTISYLVADPKTKRAAVIDPVLDYDPNRQRWISARLGQFLQPRTRVVT